jgi:hypothetical protein
MLTLVLLCAGIAWETEAWPSCHLKNDLWNECVHPPHVLPYVLALMAALAHTIPLQLHRSLGAPLFPNLDPVGRTQAGIMLSVLEIMNHNLETCTFWKCFLTNLNHVRPISDLFYRSCICEGSNLFDISSSWIRSSSLQENVVFLTRKAHDTLCGFSHYNGFVSYP